MLNRDDPVTGMKLEQIEGQLADWEADEVEAFNRKIPESQEEFRTASGIPLKRVYTALDTMDVPLEDIGLPGQFPFTRAPYPTMYRARPWTIRQVAGFGNPEDTNRRYKYLIKEGQTGISTDFDMPDPDGLRLRPPDGVRRNRPRRRRDRHDRRHGGCCSTVST